MKLCVCYAKLQVMERARLQRLRQEQLAGLVEGLEREHHSQLAAEAEQLSSQRLGYPLDGGHGKEGIPSTEGVEGATPTPEQSVDPSQDTPRASGTTSHQSPYAAMPSPTHEGAKNEGSRVAAASLAQYGFLE